MFSAHQLDPSAVKGVYSIDLKQQEVGLLAACAKHNWPTVFYTAEELRSVPGEFTDSPFVQEMTGVGNVCERAAMLRRGEIIGEKDCGGRRDRRRGGGALGGYTLGKVIVVGIGPGNFENMTIRADRALAVVRRHRRLPESMSTLSRTAIPDKALL